MCFSWYFWTHRSSLAPEILFVHLVPVSWAGQMHALLFVQNFILGSAEDSQQCLACLLLWLLLVAELLACSGRNWTSISWLEMSREHCHACPLCAVFVSCERITDTHSWSWGLCCLFACQTAADTNTDVRIHLQHGKPSRWCAVFGSEGWFYSGM